MVACWWPAHTGAPTMLTVPMIRFLCVAVFALMLVISMDAKPAQATDYWTPMMGTYAIRDGEQDVPFLRVTRDGYQFMVDMSGDPKSQDGWVRVTDSVTPLIAVSLREGGPITKDVPFPDSLHDVPDGTRCLLVAGFLRSDGGRTSFAIFYFPKEFAFGGWDRSQRLPAGYYMTSDYGGIQPLHKVK